MDEDLSDEWAPWSSLPSVVVEQIYLYLGHTDRFSMSLVCRGWNQALTSARSWHSLLIHSRSFTLKQYNVLVGFRKEFSEQKLQRCLQNIGHHIRCLTISPIDNYIHLHALIDALARYQSSEGFLTSLKELHFKYACETRSRAGSYLHGIGLPILRRLFEFLTLIERLIAISLDDLLLSREHCDDFLLWLVDLCPGVRRLSLRNFTSEEVPLNQIGLLNNLRRFITSPQQLNGSLVIKLAENGLKLLHIVQDKNTGYAAPVARHHWSRVCVINPELRVKLVCCNLYRHDVLIQPGAPVSHVLYDTLYSVVSPVTISAISEYSSTLSVYGHHSLPRIHGHHDRADSLLLLLIDNCPNLHTLIIRDRISSASVLLIAHSCRKLTRLYVRRSSVLTRLDWSHSPEWTNHFYTWLKKSSRSISTMELEISKILGYSWRTMTDGQFQGLADADI